MRVYRLPSVLPACALLLAGADARASSFALQEYSVRDMGTANAGYAAAAEDASTVFSNPAGLARLHAREFVAGGVGIWAHSKFEDQGSTRFGGLVPSGGGGDDSLAGNTVLPDLFLSLPVSERVTLGLGVTVPWGILIDYNPDWVGRYQATNSTVQSVNINPAVGVKLTDAISLGFGAAAQYFRARLTNAIDSTALMGGTPFADGNVELKGDDWAFGVNAGILVDVTPDTRVGFNYRSQVKHKLEGEADFTIDPAVSTTYGGAFTDTGIRANVDLPASYAFSVHHDASDKLALMASVLYTRWSSFRELRVDFANPVQPGISERLNSENTVRVGIGARYKLLPEFEISAGFAYDQSPIVSGFETARIPDGDRYIGALGASWTVKPGVTLDFAYQHLALANVNIDTTNATADRLVGAYKSSADLFGLGLRFAF